jgi:hypothetical protein
MVILSLFGERLVHYVFSQLSWITITWSLTHTDPKAETAALAVVEAVALSVGQSSWAEVWLSNLPSLGGDDQWKQICRKLTAARVRGVRWLGQRQLFFDINDN